MLSLTRKSDYALVALASLSREPEQPASARQIAERYGLPLPLLMNVLKNLRRAGIVQSTRGVSGGYTLGREPADITLAQVVQAIDGPIQMAICCDDPTDDEHDNGTQASPACTCQNTCPIMTPMQRLNARFASFLSKVTLQDLLDEQHDADATPSRPNTQEVAP